MVREHSGQVTSLDWDPKSGADIKCDILKWDYRALPRDSFDLIWASPDCRYYSRMQNIHLKGEARELKMQESDRFVKRVLEIIEYFKPRAWCIENPKTGRLKDRAVVADLPYVDCDYCMYSDWGYRKQTRLWTNLPLKLKLCNKKCGNMEGGKHRLQCSGRRRDQLHRIPPRLIRHILTHV